jgi:hypothetical protein
MTQNQTRRKLQEAEYFLSMMNKSFEDDDLFANNYSAFLSAVRSITFYMQNQYDDCQGFGEWYSQQQAEMKSDPESDFLNKARAENVHKEYVSTGATREIGFGIDVILVSEGSPEHRQTKAEQRDDSMQSGQRTIRRFLLLDSGKIEVIAFCQRQLAKLSRMVEECERRFQHRPEVDRRA